MKTWMHPVSLHVIRGALEFGGLGIERIRTLRPATQALPAAIYRITLRQQHGVTDGTISPNDVMIMVDACFSADVEVKDVEYVGKHWSIEIMTRAAPDLVDLTLTDDLIGQGPLA
jgi:hypothetical protein